MSFEITQAEGTAQELSVDLSKPEQHEREEAVMPVITKAITEIVESLGGYLSVSANGNINPVSGETGDVVQIYITSLPAPTVAATPAQTSPVEENPSLLNPENKTNEEIEKEARENIVAEQEVSEKVEPTYYPLPPPLFFH
jgi:hypothetical protein